MSKRASANKLQVVFSTHRESLVDFEDTVNIRHLCTGPHKTYCFEQTKPDAITRLTGNQPKPIEIFVEDEMASAIVHVILGKLKASKWASVKQFGAAINSFTMAGGLLLGGDDCSNVCFVLDGDCYRSEGDIVRQVNRVITGHGDHVDGLRNAAKDLFLSFGLPERQQPEQYFHTSLCQQPETEDNVQNEIIEAARDVVVVENNHDYLGDIFTRLGLAKGVGFYQVAQIFSRTAGWDDFVRPLQDWLLPRVTMLRESEGNE